MTPAQVDETEFYLLEYLIEDLEEKVKEENKRVKEQEREYKKQSASYPKPPKMDVPKFGNPNFGGFKTPKINIPKL